MPYIIYKFVYGKESTFRYYGIGIRTQAVTCKAEKRIQCLIDIKSNKLEGRQELADYLRVHIRTLER